MAIIKTGLDVDEDIDGNEIAAPPPETDVGRLIYLLEWARRRGFRIGPAVVVGGLTLQIQDLRQTEGLGRSNDAADEIGPWAAAGHEDGDV
jgi:hypothetical protein